MKTVLAIIILALSMIGLMSIITFSIGCKRIPIAKTFTLDFIDSVNNDLRGKIISFKDSCITHANNPEKYNSYVDSANKYISIHQYINSKIK